MGKKISLGFFIFFMLCMFISRGFCQKENEVLRRYDFSSPEASFNSYKKAILNRDFEGFMIHFWQATKDIPGSPHQGISFEELLDRLAKDSTFSLDSIGARQIYADRGYTKIDDFECVKVEKMPDSTGKILMCTLFLERKSDGNKAQAMAYNFGDGKWWIYIPLGE